MSVLGKFVELKKFISLNYFHFTLLEILLFGLDFLDKLVFLSFLYNFP